MYIKISEDKAVKPVMGKPPITIMCSEDAEYCNEYNQHLLTLPTFEVPESMRSLPVGSEIEVREQILLSYGQGSAWYNVEDVDVNNFDKEVLDAAKRRLVPCEQGEEVKAPEKFHAVEYSGYWSIQTNPYYGGKNILNAEDVGEKDAEHFAKHIVKLLNKHYDAR